jgi:aspartate dehydrogenase
LKKNIGLIGFGTIGKNLYEQFIAQDDTQVSFVYEIGEKNAKLVPAELLINSSSQLEKYLASHPVDLVVETATYQAVQELLPIILKYTDIAVFSTCAFADEAFSNQAIELANTLARKIFIPHGAILGLDGIRDGKSKLASVSITTIKKPVNLGRTDTERTVVFDGPTRSACKLYPRNVNVHASIAIAGLGFDQTHSQIIADPEAAGNIHLIEIFAEGVKFKIEICSEPIGLVTGAYTPVSAFNSVHKLFSTKGFLII